MADFVPAGGYPTSPLEKFVTGAFEGYDDVYKLAKKANDLKIQNKNIEAMNERANMEAAGVKPQSQATGVPGLEGPPSDTTGTGGAGGAGGGGVGQSPRSGGWGPLAQPAIDALKQAGLSDAAIQGIMANGLGEGGFKDSWQKAWGDEESYGHWQFYKKGELPAYQAWAQGKGDYRDTGLQARYVAQRMEEIHPGFSKLTDPKQATDLVATGFEKYQGAKPGQRYGHLSEVQRQMAGGRAAVPFEFAQVPDTSGAPGELGAPLPAAAALQPAGFGVGANVFGQPGMLGVPAAPALAAPAAAPAAPAVASAAPGQQAALTAQPGFGTRTLPDPRVDEMRRKFPGMAPVVPYGSVRPQAALLPPSPVAQAALANPLGAPQQQQFALVPVNSGLWG